MWTNMVFNGMSGISWTIVGSLDLELILSRQTKHSSTILKMSSDILGQNIMSLVFFQTLIYSHMSNVNRFHNLTSWIFWYEYLMSLEYHTIYLVQLVRHYGSTILVHEMGISCKFLANHTVWRSALIQHSYQVRVLRFVFVESCRTSTITTTPTLRLRYSSICCWEMSFNVL